MGRKSPTLYKTVSELRVKVRKGHQCHINNLEKKATTYTYSIDNLNSYGLTVKNISLVLATNKIDMIKTVLSNVKTILSSSIKTVLLFSDKSVSAVNV